jgi:hypothetical protein
VQVLGRIILLYIRKRDLDFSSMRLWFFSFPLGFLSFIFPMSRHGSVATLSTLWFSGRISDLSSDTPDERDLCVTVGPRVTHLFHVVLVWTCRLVPALMISILRASMPCCLVSPLSPDSTFVDFTCFDGISSALPNCF